MRKSSLKSSRMTLQITKTNLEEGYQDLHLGQAFSLQYHPDSDKTTTGIDCIWYLRPSVFPWFAPILRKWKNTSLI